MSVSIVMLAVMATLYACGVYLLLERSMTRVLLGFLLVGNATNLLLITMVGRVGSAPIVEAGLTGMLALAGVLGLYTAWLGWDAWAVGLFLGFLAGGVWGLGLIAVRRGGRKTAVPFGPFMLLGVLVAVLAGPELAQAYLDSTGV